MKTLKNQQGTVIVFATLMIVLLLVMVGLGLDTGQLTYVRNQGQAAVDSAALAAVTGLPFRNDDQVKSRARGFNSKNTYAGSATNTIGNDDVSYVQYDFATNTITNYAGDVNTANGVRVALESTSSISTPMFLTPLFNLMGIPTAKNQNVSVSAVSVITTKPAVPIALWTGVCNGSTPVNVTISAAANDSGAIAQNYAAGASLTIAVQIAAAGCGTSPADANVVVQYRMQ